MGLPNKKATCHTGVRIRDVFLNRFTSVIKSQIGTDGYVHASIFSITHNESR